MKDISKNISEIILNNMHRYYGYEMYINKNTIFYCDYYHNKMSKTKYCIYRAYHRELIKLFDKYTEMFT